MNVPVPWVRPTNGFLGAKDGKAGQAVLLGVPLDVTCSFRPGARFGPGRIREVSDGLEEYSWRLERELSQLEFIDIGDLDMIPGNVEQSLARIEQSMTRLIERGCKIAVLGGEHLLTFPVVKTLKQRFTDLVVIQWDAHADRRTDYLGQELSHASVMHLIGALGIPVYQMGVRSIASEELDEVKALQNGELPGAFFTEEVLSPLIQVLPELRDRPVYLSCDIDVIDPAFAPGTGAPEPGGVAPREIFEAVVRLGDLNLVGFDVVEVNPMVDAGDCTSLLAAKLVRELLLTCFR